MKKLLLAFTLLVPFTLLAEPIGPGDAGNQQKWFVAGNVTPVADTTPVVIITPIPTPTGTPVAATRNYITDLTVSNSHASVDTDVELLNGSTIKWVCPAAHAGGGCTKSFATPLRGTVGSSWSCKSVTTGASIRCQVGGYFSDK